MYCNREFLSMLCDKCKKNEATVHIKEFHNGKCKDFHLCNECASAGETDQTLPGIGFNLAEVLFNVNKIREKVNHRKKPRSVRSVHGLPKKSAKMMVKSVARRVIKPLTSSSSRQFPRFNAVLCIWANAPEEQKEILRR